jgi:membrane protein YdbS with pleckstrin-like domain
LKLFIKIVLLAIIDFLVIGFWVKENDPDPSISIAIVILVPIVIIINLLIALLFYFVKKEHSKLFILNSIISAILMYCLFQKGIDIHQNLRYESWRFEIKDTVFKITHSKLGSTFSLSESSNSGSSTSILDGKFTQKGNEFYLTTDTTEYKIKNEYLYGFKNIKDSIKLTKIEY